MIKYNETLLNNVNAGKFKQAAELQNTFQISDVIVNPIIVPIIKSKLQTKNLDRAIELYRLFSIPTDEISGPALELFEYHISRESLKMAKAIISEFQLSPEMCNPPVIKSIENYPFN